MPGGAVAARDPLDFRTDKALHDARQIVVEPSLEHGTRTVFRGLVGLMVSKYLQKEDTPILERSRIGNRLGHQAARFWPAEAEPRNLRKPACWGAIRFGGKTDAERAVRQCRDAGQNIGVMRELEDLIRLRKDNLRTDNNLLEPQRPREKKGDPIS